MTFETILVEEVDGYSLQGLSPGMEHPDIVQQPTAFVPKPFSAETALRRKLLDANIPDVVCAAAGQGHNVFCEAEISSTEQQGDTYYRACIEEGTHAARFASTEHTVLLRPGSALFEELGSQVPWPGPPVLPRLVTFWSSADLLLLPPETARVEGAEHVEMAGSTHYDYLIQPRGWRRAFEALLSPR